jgi:toxin-antitoxin system PIN domain toxin
VKLPDVNLFLYAYDSRSTRHAAARDWLEQTLSGTETVGLAWIVLLAFIRLSTRPRVVERPLDANAAIELVESWLEQPCVTAIDPTERHTAVLRELLAPLGTAGSLTTDAHLAALAIEHGALLCSCDTDFSRFGGLRWADPLSDSQSQSRPPAA